jgi:uncharacterized membrane-anchored protein
MSIDRSRRSASGRWLTVLGLTLLAVGSATAQTINWTPGPTTVDLGDKVAQLELGQAFLFANAAETRKFLEASGNFPSGNEVGLVTSTAEDESWFVIFEYEDVGYIKDDDKDQIDADAILESYREGTEESNKRRQEKGIPALHITGWFERPHYDQTTHNLVWALQAKDDTGDQVVNHNVRLLGREGYMSVTVVDDPSALARSLPKVKQVLAGFSYKQGKRYAEFRAGDKIAKYGLVALVAGGAGAAAAKLGLFAALGKLLAKGGKLIVVAVIGLLAFLKRLFTGGSRNT